ncbi:N-acetylneuraminate synthase family protein [Polynucleobacter sp. MWH-UH19D]|uniref:N-acetylneuraminate synthase family protein n=1 Tax=Polynucleobacter sp. MWH-UH19D TaxID=1855610 RepID=UPI003364F5FC
MNYSFNRNNKVFIVAEIGNNHEGSFDLALEMVEAAAKTGVDAVKFQTFIPAKYVSSEDSVRLERLNKFKLSNEQYLQIAKRAEELGIVFFSTPFDLESAAFLNKIQPIFKISSGDNNFFPLIEEVASYKKPTIISSGLADLGALKYLVDFWHGIGGRDENLIIMHCVSSYPVPVDQANLRAISTLKNIFPNLIIGYSDHTLGIQACVLAVAAGAGVIEKHFTLSKNQSDFRDHQLSADPLEMRSLVTQVREASILLGSGVKNLQPCEIDMVKLMRRSIAASHALNAGQLICKEDLTWVRPGNGFSVGRENEVIGKKILRDVIQGELITKDNLI